MDFLKENTLNTTVSYINTSLVSFVFYLGSKECDYKIYPYYIDYVVLCY